MKLYSDRGLKNEIQEINFGIVEAGASKTITVYVHNDTKAVISNLVFEFGDVPIGHFEDLDIIHAPKTIQPGKTEDLILKWSPSMNFKQALELPITIKGDEIYLAEHHVEK